MDNKNINENIVEEENMVNQPVNITKLNLKDIKEIEADELVDRVMQQILQIK